jgi:DNA-binding MarR family transcriptional regulator
LRDWLRYTRHQRNLSRILINEEKQAGGDGPEPQLGPLADLSSLSASGPLTSTARIAILAALLAFKKTTFTELMLAVNLPKSSLNLSLAVLQENHLVTVRKGFIQLGGPRTFIEITPEGEKAIKEHLMKMQDLARKLLLK